MGKTIGRIQWTIVALLWIYIVYRAVFFAITEDEAYSYFLLKTHSWRALPGTANTHWLNTIIMRLFMWLPGADRPYKFRMLSVCSWWVFAYSVIKLCSFFRNKWVGIAFFAAALLNPFLLFYFSLSRGYSAGCAFAMLSLWQAALLLQKEEWRPARWVLVLIPASVAVLANFCFFYFFIGVTGTYLFHLFLSGNLRRLRERSAWRWWILTGGTFLFAAGSLLFIRLHSRELEFAEYPDLVRSSFGSLVKGSLWYDASPAPALVLGTALFIILLLFSLISLYWYFRSKRLSLGIFSLNVFVLILLQSVVFHVLFGTSFLYGRTALVIYVTILPGVFGIIDRAAEVGPRPIQREKTREDAAELKSASQGGGLFRSVFASGPTGAGAGFRVSMGVLIFFLCFNFYKRFNTRYFYEWPVQADTQECLDHLVRSDARKVGMGLWHRDVFIFYYALAYPGKYGFSCQLVTENDLKKDPGFDHLLLSVPSDGDSSDLGHWRAELYYPATGAMILGMDSAGEGRKIK